jgi:acyl-CoA synthetase (AMP-forming)/AMP-acid ligase II
MECRIVEPSTGETVRAGEVGEFQVRGYGLMRGLYKRERQESFTRDGFYRTKDLGYMEGGKFFFNSRLDDLIKTRGANVAPAEVEAVLNACPGVRISFVVGLPHDLHGEEVAAAVVADGSVSLDVGVLRAECRQSLSSYKVPRLFAVLGPEDIPRLPSSKLDRRGLVDLLAEHRRAQPDHYPTQPVS